jgi:UDP-N-acetylmuramate-alanine ligase
MVQPITVVGVLRLVVMHREDAVVGLADRVYVADVYRAEEADTIYIVYASVSTKVTEVKACVT